MSPKKPPPAATPPRPKPQLSPKEKDFQTWMEELELPEEDSPAPPAPKKKGPA
jgi:hypothetical protein